MPERWIDLVDPDEATVAATTTALKLHPLVAEDILEGNQRSKIELTEEHIHIVLFVLRYGERMAVDWLDVSRYADSYGFQVDRDRPVWWWRDWVVDAFNRNLPWNDFVTWQLAGDLLPNATDEQILATAFNRLHQQEADIDRAAEAPGRVEDQLAGRGQRARQHRSPGA